MELTGKAKAGLMRSGKRVYITLEFEDEYAAMQHFDIWSHEDITFSFKGPKYLVEEDQKLGETK